MRLGLKRTKISKRKKQYYEANQDRISEYYRMRYAHNKRNERLTLFIISVKSILFDITFC